MESTEVNELFEDLAEILCITGEDNDDLSSSSWKVSDERSWLAAGKPAGVPKTKHYHYNLWPSSRQFFPIL